MHYFTVYGAATTYATRIKSNEIMVLCDGRGLKILDNVIP